MERNVLLTLIFSVMLLLFFSQCSSVTKQKQELITTLKDVHGIKLKNNIDRLFILNDMGCSSCVVAFSEYVKENVDDPNSLILVQSRGHNIDIESFVEKSKLNPNIIISHNVNNTDKFLSELSVIYLNNTDIDTIIHIRPAKIAE